MQESKKLRYKDLRKYIKIETAVVNSLYMYFCF